MNQREFEHQYQGTFAQPNPLEARATRRQFLALAATAPIAPVPTTPALPDALAVAELEARISCAIAAALQIPERIAFSSDGIHWMLTSAIERTLTTVRVSL